MMQSGNAPYDFLKCLSDRNVPSSPPLVSDIIQVSDKNYSNFNTLCVRMLHNGDSTDVKLIIQLVKHRFFYPIKKISKML